MDDCETSRPFFMLVFKIKEKIVVKLAELKGFWPTSVGGSPLRLCSGTVPACGDSPL